MGLWHARIIEVLSESERPSSQRALAWIEINLNEMDSFEYSALPGRVVFGRGSIRKLPDEVKRLNKTKPLLLSTPQQAEQVRALEPILKDGSINPVGLYSQATMHTPTHITDDALKYANDCGADCVISFGGGSTIGLGKAISIRTGLEHICIPTTYAGSEMTPILGETADGKKTTRSDPKILPGTTIYDVEFTLTLPESLSATSGVNAIAHAGRKSIECSPTSINISSSGGTVRSKHESNLKPPCPRRNEGLSRSASYHRE